MTDALNEIKPIEPPSPGQGPSNPYKVVDNSNSMNANITVKLDKKFKVTKRVPLRIDYDAIKLRQIDEIIEQQHDDKDFFV